MTVRGGSAVAAALRLYPARLRSRLEDAISEAAELLLADMRRRVPRDSGALARALVTAMSESGLAAHIGLPTRRLPSRYFYARFIEAGTKGGQVTYRRRGSAKIHTMNVPFRAARPFMRPALDLNRAAVERMIRDAVANTIREGRR